MRLAESATVKDLADMIAEMIEKHPQPKAVVEAVRRRVGGW